MHWTFCNQTWKLLQKSLKLQWTIESIFWSFVACLLLFAWLFASLIWNSSKLTVYQNHPKPARQASQTTKPKISYDLLTIWVMLVTHTRANADNLTVTELIKYSLWFTQCFYLKYGSRNMTRGDTIILNRFFEPKIGSNRSVSFTCKIFWFIDFSEFFPIFDLVPSPSI